MKNEFVKKCPLCSREMKYARKWYLEQSVKNNTKCKSCSKVGRIFSEEHKKKISVSNIGKIM